MSDGVVSVVDVVITLLDAAIKAASRTKREELIKAIESAKLEAEKIKKDPVGSAVRRFREG